ncbi:hypothetical protein GYMLUDRAFT_737085 [Collybiopsis luxurians FD-317 M1]|uniref:Uncharacterized protein n=1 Tax=Collybiopsis luxurians FD-317 M1 TaxID=944289 RepID=A0A0D0B3R9_9AGAR|nr:hypothetical protein GYMLUDRAFT_737085 [Collybiopsis luxurians FD-317 M1]
MEDTINSKRQMPIEEMPVSTSTQDHKTNIQGWHFGPHEFDFCSSPEPIFLDPPSVVVTNSVDADTDSEADSDADELAPSISHRTKVPAEIIPNDIIEFSAPVSNFDLPGPYTYPKDIFDEFAAPYIPAAPVVPPPPQWSYPDPVPFISSTAAPIQSAHDWTPHYLVPRSQTQSYPGIDDLYPLAPPALSTAPLNDYASAIYPHLYPSPYTPSSPYAKAPIPPYPAMNPAPYPLKDSYVPWRNLDVFAKDYIPPYDDEGEYEPSEYLGPGSLKARRAGQANEEEVAKGSFESCVWLWLVLIGDNDVPARIGIFVRRR